MVRWQLGLVLLAACGRVADDAASDGSADAVSDVVHHLDASSDVADAESDASADAIAADGVPTPVCEDGVYYVTVVDDAGTHVFDGGCDDAGVPDVTAVVCGMKIICESVSACNAGSVRVVGFGAPGVANVTISYAADGDASTLFYGKRTIANWPPAGGTVSGVFAGAEFDGGPSVAGSFCVLRR